MNDVVEMAVVDAREDLLGQNSGVLLRELASLEDFIEELSTLANSLMHRKYIRLRHGLVK